jgi:hypothetical protein
MRTRPRKALAIIILPVAVLLLTLPAATALAGPSATDLTSLSTDDVTSTTTDTVGDVTSTTTDTVGDLTSTTTDTVGDLTSTTTDTVGDLTQPESPPDGSASPGSPTAGTDSTAVPKESVTAVDAGETFGGPATANAFDGRTARMPSPLLVLANRGPVRTGRPTAAMSAQPVCGVVNLHRDGGVLGLTCSEDPASHGSAVLGLVLGATGAALLLLVALALGFGVTGSGLLTVEELLGRTSSAAAD